MAVPFFKRPASALAFATFLAGTSGCSLINDRTEDYVNEPEGEPLKTADDHRMERQRDVYPIREIDSNPRADTSVGEIPEPPDMTSEILEENYVVESVDDQTWVLVNDVPGRLWPAIAGYLNDRGLGVEHDSTQLGLMQSDVVNFSRRARELLELPDEPEGEEKLAVVQARINPGVRRKTTEVQLRVLNPDEAPEQLLEWQTESSNPSTERRLLEDLSGYLQSRDDTKSYSRAALGMTSDPRVRMVEQAGEPRQLEMSLSYDRAWSETRRALEDAEIPVVDLDRTAGRLYVDYRSEEETEPGWFSWFADDPEPEYTFHVDLEQDDDRVLLTTGRSADHDGEDRSAELLDELYEYLY